jgi:ribose transport system permease protein
LLVCLAVFWFLHKSRFGRYLFGMGTNLKVCLLSGVKTKKLTYAVYMLTSSLAGLAGILLFGYIGNTYLTLGAPYQMDSIAAVVLGGTSIVGGSGSFLGTIAGVLILTILRDTLSVLRLVQSWRDILLGVIIVSLLLIYGREKVRGR